MSRPVSIKDIARDVAKVGSAGADVVFAPDVAAMKTSLIVTPCFFEIARILGSEYDRIGDRENLASLPYGAGIPQAVVDLTVAVPFNIEPPVLVTTTW